MLLQELRIQSDGFNRPIKHIWYPIQEVSRFTNSTKEEVKRILRILINAGILYKKSSEPLLFDFTEEGKLPKSGSEIDTILKMASSSDVDS